MFKKLTIATIFLFSIGTALPAIANNEALDSCIQNYDFGNGNEITEAVVQAEEFYEGSKYFLIRAHEGPSFFWTVFRLDQQENCKNVFINMPGDAKPSDGREVPRQIGLKFDQISADYTRKAYGISSP